MQHSLDNAGRIERQPGGRRADEAERRSMSGHSTRGSGTRHPNESYEVGWICALVEELAAARAMLDEDHGVFQYKENGDNNTYAVGRIHKHNVVIACLPTGIDGIAAAAIVAQNMMRTFSQIRVGLLVGIGGGIPNLEKGIDIRLGDIVVSQPTGEHGGVVQYAKGKWQEDGDGPGQRFVRKGSLDKPPLFLLNALGMLQAQHETDHSRISVYLKETLERNPRMNAGYAFPGADQDHFFETVPFRIDGERLDNDTDYNLTPSYVEVVRPRRDSSTPVIHYGNIASGDQVIKHAGVRDALRDEYGAICVEMEAAGLMGTFPCLVIRGICDYADSFKNDVWHRYAAVAAAAYAKEFLLYVSPQQVHQGKTAQVNVADLLARGNRSLNTLWDRIARKDLLNARHDFSLALSALTDQTPPARPKDLARVYQKLMSTSLRLSHLRGTTAERISHMNDATRYGKLALENAVKSGNSDRVVQMRFYAACVRARELTLWPETVEEREIVLARIAEALSEVRGVEGLDLKIYEGMAREYSMGLTE